jgi:hypothetical protein
LEAAHKRLLKKLKEGKAIISKLYILGLSVWLNQLLKDPVLALMMTALCVSVVHFVKDPMKHTLGNVWHTMQR